jgi:hypothetical protein
MLPMPAALVPTASRGDGAHRLFMIGQPIQHSYVETQTTARRIALQFVFTPRQLGEALQQAFSCARDGAPVGNPSRVFHTSLQFPVLDCMPQKQTEDLACHLQVVGVQTPLPGHGEPACHWMTRQLTASDANGVSEPRSAPR